MNAYRFQQVAAIFGPASRLSDNERCTFIASACSDDDDLRNEVESLLRVDDSLPAPFSESALLDRASRWAHDALREDHGGRMPSHIGCYEIVDVLGTGGTGIVYRALQPAPHRHIALKVLRSEFASDETRRRFDLEAAILARLQHANIAQVYEAGSADLLPATHPRASPMPFIAMELVEGEPITAYARARALNTEGRIELLVQVCRALEHAHDRGIIHRDLKPANIIVMRSGEAKVVDFGIACLAGAADASTTRTRPGPLLGTLAYMSPEQLAGGAALVDARSDVYSLGIVAYELLAGCLPLDPRGMTIAESIIALSRMNPPTLPAGDVASRTLHKIVQTACARNPGSRYQSAGALRRDLERFLHQAVESRRRRAHRRTIAALVAMPLVLLPAGLASLQLSDGDWVAGDVDPSQDIDSSPSPFELPPRSIHRAVTGGPPEPRPLEQYFTDLHERGQLDQHVASLEARLAQLPASARREELSLRNQLAAACAVLGRLEDQETHLREFIRMRSALIANNHPSLLLRRVQLGWNLVEQQRYGDAADTFEEVLAISPDSMNEHDVVAQCRVGLALAHMRAGRLDLAAEPLATGIRQLREAFGPDHHATKHAEEVAAEFNRLTSHRQ